MVTIGIDPVIVHLGHFGLRWYGVIMVAAIAVGTWVTLREAERKGFDRNTVLDGVMWIILSAIVGARLFHVADHWSDVFAAQPLRALAIWEGGLAMWGGVYGGLGATVWLSWRHRWRLTRLVDAIVPGLLLGQGIGRFACVITGDAMGRPTSGPFGVAYSNPGAVVPALGVYYAPTPIYEALLNFGLFALLWKLRKRNLPHGFLALIYLAAYSLIRFVVAYTSSYRIIYGGLTQSQIVALITLAAVVPLGVYVWKKGGAPAARAG
jgi:phosphatidylglycerol---prolipoprotein diacylglyceryl transferase